MNLSLAFCLAIICFILSFPSSSQAAPDKITYGRPLATSQIFSPDTDDRVQGLELVEELPDFVRNDDIRDEMSKTLAEYLTGYLGMPFVSMAGEMEVDVITMPNGKRGYAFVVRKQEMVRPTENAGSFYYDCPAVFGAMRFFFMQHEEFQKTVWHDRRTGIFIFVVSTK